MATLVPISGPGAGKAAAKLVPVSPVKSSKGDPDYKKELAKQRAERDAYYKKLSPADRAAESYVAQVPFMDELHGAIRAGGNELVNVGRRVAGKDTVSSRAIYDASRRARDEYNQRLAKEHPVLSTVGGLLTPVGPVSGPAAWVAKGTGKLGKLGRGAVVSGLLGGVTGAAEGEGLDRAKNAAVGTALGAGGGVLLEGIAAPVAKKVAEKTVGAGRKVESAVASRLDPKRLGERGTRSGLELLQRKGLTSENVAEKAAEQFGDVPVTIAEVAGPQGTRKLSQLTRQEGETGDVVRDLLGARRGATEGRMLGGMAADIGINPAAAQGNIDETVELGRSMARPLYEAAEAVPHGITSPELEALMARGPVKDVVKEIENLGLIGDDVGVGMAYGDVPVPSRPVGPDELAIGGGDVPVPRGPAEPPGRGPSALTALRQTGRGITSEMAGEAKQQGLRLRAQTGGAELHDMANRLFEQGYTPRVLSDDEMAALLENGARGLYARGPDPAAQARFEARAQAEDINAQGGLPGDVPTPEQYEGSFSMPERPMTEAVRTTAPTQGSYDQILKGLDQQVTRDPITKEPIMEGTAGTRNREILALGRRFRELLFGGETPLAPELKAAREVSSDYMGLSGAFKLGRGKLGQNVNEAQFARAWKRVKDKPAQADNFKGGVAADLYDLWTKNGITSRKMMNPLMRTKLEMAFGKKEADALLTRVEQETNAARTGRIIDPEIGSQTFGLFDSAKPGALSTFDKWVSGASVLGGIATGNPLVALPAAVSLGRRGVEKLADLNENERNAMGRILTMGVDEIAPLLRELENMPPILSEAVQKRAHQLGLRMTARAAGQAGDADRYAEEPIY